MFSIEHFHTGGNPGRHEIDGTQELDYHFVSKAIADLGFQGQIAHEYTPVRDPIASLKQAMEIPLPHARGSVTSCGGMLSGDALRGAAASLSQPVGRACFAR